MAKVLAKTKSLHRTLSKLSPGRRSVSSCPNVPLSVFHPPSSVGDNTITLILKANYDDFEHTISSTQGDEFFTVSERDYPPNARRICDEAGNFLCSVAKKYEHTFNIVCDDPDEPLAAVVYVEGKPCKPKLQMMISKNFATGDCSSLKIKGDLFGMKFEVYQTDPDGDGLDRTLVGIARPKNDSGSYEMEVAPKIDLSLMVAISIVISEMRGSLQNVLVDPPLVILNEQAVATRKCVLTPVVIDDMLAVMDCQLNTVVYRGVDRMSYGRGQFMAVSGNRSFVLEQKKKKLFVFLHGKSGMGDKGVLVFSKKKVRGVREICVAKVKTFNLIDQKDEIKAGCLLKITVDLNKEPEIKMKADNSKGCGGSLIGRFVTAAKSPQEYSAILDNCKQADPRGALKFENFGVCVEVAAGVDLEFMSAVILSTLVFIPELGKLPAKSSRQEGAFQELSGNIQNCVDVLDLQPVQ